MLFEHNSFITTGTVPLEELDSNPRDSFFQEISAFSQRQLAPLATTDCRRCRRQLPAVAAVTGSCPSRRRSEGEGLSRPWLWPHMVVAVKLMPLFMLRCQLSSTNVAKLLCQVCSPVLGGRWPPLTATSSVRVTCWKLDFWKPLMILESSSFSGLSDRVTDVRQHSEKGLGWGRHPCTRCQMALERRVRF